MRVLLLFFAKEFCQLNKSSNILLNVLFYTKYWILFVTSFLFKYAGDSEILYRKLYLRFMLNGKPNSNAHKSKYYLNND